MRTSVNLKIYQEVAVTKRNAINFPIKASAGGVVSALASSWYSIKATANNAAEIWIYDEIGGWGLSAKRFAQDLTDKGDIKNITLRIHSPGGDVFEGMAIYNLLANHPATITVYIDGLAASMASVIAMAGDTIIMPENSMMMIHKPWGITGGDAEDMRSYADLMDKVEANLITAYTKKTGKTADEIAALLASETWMTAAEAVEMGFADQTSAALQMAASLTSNRLQDFKNMPKELQNIFKPRAQVTVPPTVTPSSDPAPANEADIRAKFIAENKTRTDAITNLFANFGNRHSDIQASCIADLNCTVEQAKDKLLAALGRNTTPSPPSNNAHIYADNGNIVGDSVRNAVMSRAGHVEAQADNRYLGMTLRELARASLTDRGVGIAGANPMNMVGLAFTHSTSDFGAILLDTANKSVLQGWEFAEETFEKWTKKGELSDFKTATRVGMGAFPSLREVRQGAEYQYVTVGDRASTICLATYGEIFSLTRQCIINDDMQMLTDIPMKMGMAAKATIGDLVYAVLTSNPTLTLDKTKLFHADHANLGAGALSVQSLDAHRQMMRKQKLGERHLNIRPAFVLVPTCLESTAGQIIKSTSVKGADVNSGIANPIQNFAEVIAEPRLDDASEKEWYLASAKGTDTIEVAYLHGIDTPYIEQQQGFGIDGVATKVRIDAGVAPIDFRGLTKSSGA